MATQSNVLEYPAFIQGDIARTEGKPLTANPYTGKEAAEWAGGWIDADDFLGEE